MRPKGLCLHGKGDIVPVIIGVKQDRQVLKGGKVLPEAVGVFTKQTAILLISAFQQLPIGHVKCLGHQLQQSFPLKAPAVEGLEGVIGYLIVPAVFQDVEGGLQLGIRLAVLGVSQGQGIGRHGVPMFPQLRHPAGDIQSGLFLHIPSPPNLSSKIGAGLNARPPVVAMVAMEEQLRQMLTAAAATHPGAPGSPGPAWPGRTGSECCSWYRPSSRRPRQCPGWWTRHPGCSPA